MRVRPVTFDRGQWPESLVRIQSLDLHKGAFVSPTSSLGPDNDKKCIKGTLP